MSRLDHLPPFYKELGWMQRHELTDEQFKKIENMLPGWFHCSSNGYLEVLINTIEQFYPAWRDLYEEISS
jgi:hypothetical protein